MSLRSALGVPGVVTAVTAGYYASVPLIMAVINAGVPMWLEKTLFVLSAPAIFSVLPWVPLLRRWGLSEGEWIVGPSLPAYIALALLYVALAGLCAWVVCRWWTR